MESEPAGGFPGGGDLLAGRIQMIQEKRLKVRVYTDERDTL